MNVEQINEEILNTFTKKELYYYKMVNRYFRTCEPKLIEKMISIINGESKISLRILDWFVTRYAAKYKICFGTIIDDSLFNVHISYKAQLKSYKKRYFDPFRRRKKFIYNYDKNDETKILTTTLGQLNFFYWALSNNVVEHVEKNIEHITKTMVIMNKESRIKKKIMNNSDTLNSLIMQKTKKIIKNYDKNTNTNTCTGKNTSNKIVLVFD